MSDIGSSQQKQRAPGERLRWLAVVAAGVYCWAVTVLPGVRQAGLASLAGVFGVVALVVQVGSLLAPPGPWFRRMAVDCFVASCLVSWWLAGPIEPDRSFGGFGALGFFAYTFALGSLSTPRALSAFAVDEARFVARTPPRKSAFLVVLALIPVTIVLLLLAWRVERPAVGVLAHVLSLGALLLLLRGGSLVAEALQTEGTRLHRAPSLRRAWAPLALLGVVALGALVWFW